LETWVDLIQANTFFSDPEIEHAGIVITNFAPFLVLPSSVIVQP
jgi:hypothetical protein